MYTHCSFPQSSCTMTYMYSSIIPVCMYHSATCILLVCMYHTATHLVRLVSLERTCQDTSSACVSEENGSVPQKTTGRHLQSDTGTSTLQKQKLLVRFLGHIQKKVLVRFLSHIQSLSVFEELSVDWKFWRSNTLRLYITVWVWASK